MKSKNQEEHKYGTISLLAMIVGIVIGSGIFFKGNQLIRDNGSTIISLIAWAIVSITILAITISYMEISTISSKKKSTMSLSNWGRQLISPAFGKVIGYFFIFVYFPVSFAAFAAYGGDFVVESIQVTDGSLLTKHVDRYLVVTVFAFFVTILICVMNGITKKGGKVFQVFGTVIKIFPIILVIFLIILFAAVPKWNAKISGGSFDPNSPKNLGLFVKGTGELKSGGDLTKLILLSLPPILFSFDGFIFSASLQSEAKSKKNFKWTLLFGMILIIALYVSYTISTFELGDNIADGKGYGVDRIVAALIPSAKTWLPVLITTMIIISILSTFSGVFISSIRSFSSLSEENQVLDRNGYLLKRNKEGIPYNSAWVMFLLSIIALIILRLLDGAVLIFPAHGQNTQDVNLLASTDYASDLGVLGAFFFYISISLGGVANRFTEKYTTEKIFGFIPASILGSLVLLVIIGADAYRTMEETVKGISEGGKGFSSYYRLVIFILTIIPTPLIYLYNYKKLKTADEKMMKKKGIYIKEYRNFSST